MWKILATPLAAALITTTLSCGKREPPAWTATVERVASPSGKNSSEPFIATSDGGLLLSWIEREGTTTFLKFAELTGSGWTGATTAASGAGWFLNYADVPTVIRLSDSTLAAQWLQTTDERLEAYDLKMSYSKDNGKTWAPSFMPHHDGTKSQHGFASMFQMTGGGLGVIWLDGRNSEITRKPDSGSMTVRFASFDSNWKQSADTEIDHRVCECCPTAVAVTPNGVVTAFRDRSEDETRDIVASRFESGSWTTPSPISQDKWMVDICPVNGPALSARGRDVAAAWFTVKDNLGQAFVAFSSDAGGSWGAPIRVDDMGSLGRVDVEMLDDGSAVATWIEYAEGQSDLRMRRVEPSGTRSAPMNVAPVSGGRSSGYPRLGKLGNELVFAWTDSAEGSDAGGLEVRTAVARLP